jgi:hypothetical protein
MTEASNAVVDMVQAGNLDAAEQAAHEPLARLCCMDPFVVAGGRGATHIAKPISISGSALLCRSNTTLNTVTTFPSPDIGSRTGQSMMRH